MKITVKAETAYDGQRKGKKGPKISFITAPKKTGEENNLHVLQSLLWQDSTHILPTKSTNQRKFSYKNEDASKGQN